MFVKIKKAFLIISSILILSLSLYIIKGDLTGNSMPKDVAADRLAVTFKPGTDYKIAQQAISKVGGIIPGGALGYKQYVETFKDLKLDGITIDIKISNPRQEFMVLKKYLEILRTDKNVIRADFSIYGHI